MACAAAVDRVLPDVKSSSPLESISLSGITLLQADFGSSLIKLRKEKSDDIGAPHIPEVLWSDIGGLAHAKRDILETIQVFIFL